MDELIAPSDGKAERTSVKERKRKCRCERVQLGKGGSGCVGLWEYGACGTCIGFGAAEGLCLYLRLCLCMSVPVMMDTYLSAGDKLNRGEAEFA